MRDLRPLLRGAPLAPARLSRTRAALEPAQAARIEDSAERAPAPGRAAGDPAAAPSRRALTVP